MSFLISIKAKIIVGLAAFSLAMIGLVKWYAGRVDTLKKKAEKAELKLEITKHQNDYKVKVLENEKKAIKEKGKSNDKKSKSNIVDRW